MRSKLKNYITHTLMKNHVIRRATGGPNQSPGRFAKNVMRKMHKAAKYAFCGYYTHDRNIMYGTRSLACFS